jgi:ABC-2 type transport system permease protein
MNLTKVWQVARREFLATVSTRAFIFGLLFLPAMLTFTFTVVPRLMNQRNRPIEGQILVIDDSGRAAPEIARALSAEALTARRDAAARQLAAQLPDSVRGFAAAGTQQAFGVIPNLTVEQRPGPFAVDEARRWLLDTAEGRKHLAVIAVRRDAVDRDAAGGDFGSYALYVPVNVDNRLENTLYDGVRDALVALRASAQGLNIADVQSMLNVTRARAVTLSTGADRTTEVATFARALPFIFLGLMFMGIMIGGQGLLTTTIEEKSSRVVEVMLSAVSPLELMTGKLLGYMAVSLVAMSVYLALGLMALASFAMLGLIEPSLIVYLLVFFAVAYVFNGAVMVAVGAAVNDLREAQSLMTPVTVVTILPWLLASPIAQNPSSPLAIVMSFLPPFNIFGMLLRIASTAPPPAWQVWLSIGIGALASGIVVIGAAKIYRIGLLMYGKPPDFATLMRWVRAA